MKLLLRWLPRLFLLLTAAYAIGWLSKRSKPRPMPHSQSWFLHIPLRRFVHPVRRTLLHSHLQAGDTVLELGPGTGYFSIEASRVIGDDGRLLCLDIQLPMLVDLAGRLCRANAANAELLLSDAMHLPLADDCVDTAFLVAVLGEIPDRSQALAELRRILRPGGVLSITESLTDPDYQREDSLRELCQTGGFEPMEHIRGFLGYTMNFAAP